MNFALPPCLAVLSCRLEQAMLTGVNPCHNLIYLFGNSHCKHVRSTCLMDHKHCCKSPSHRLLRPLLSAHSVCIFLASSPIISDWRKTYVVFAPTMHHAPAARRVCKPLCPLGVWCVLCLVVNRCFATTYLWCCGEFARVSLSA